MKKSEIKIFSGTSNLPLSQQISKYTNVPLSDLEVRNFSDGEISIKVKENVRGADVFFIQSTSAPANDNLMELMLVVDALRRASARRITVVMPYYGYGRQDRKVEPRVPISAKVIANMIEGVGVDRMLCMDLHADQIQGFFQIPVDHLFSAPVIVKYFRQKKIPDLVIVSPDSGGAERARFFAKQLDAEMAIIDKRRQKANVSEVMNVIGNVKNKNCFLVDDMIDTAGTICKAAEALKKEGASVIFSGATHAVLSGPVVSKIESSVIDEMVLTNTIDLPEEKLLKNITILSVAELIGEAINRIHKEESVNSLFL